MSHQKVLAGTGCAKKRQSLIFGQNMEEELRCFIAKILTFVRCDTKTFPTKCNQCSFYVTKDHTSPTPPFERAPRGLLRGSEDLLREEKVLQLFLSQLHLS